MTASIRRGFALSPILFALAFGAYAQDDHAGHGTIMLSRDSELGRRLVDWFRRTL